MNRDFVEMLSALSDADAEYLLAGAHALGRPRDLADAMELRGESSP